MHIVQVLDYPALKVDVDRQRAAQVGHRQRDVANNLLISLSSSAWWRRRTSSTRTNNVNYTVVVKTPLQQLASVSRAAWRRR